MHYKIFKLQHNDILKVTFNREQMTLNCIILQNQQRIFNSHQNYSNCTINHRTNKHLISNYFAPVCVCVCLFVCLYTHMSQKPHIHILLKFLYMLPVAMARSSSDENATRYVLSVLSVTSCFHIMVHIQ